MDVLKRLADKGYCKRTAQQYYKPTHRKLLIAHCDHEIVKHYNSVWRGIRNYYSCSDYSSPLSRIKYILRVSCALTLSAKHRRSASKTYKKHSKLLSVRYINPENGKIKQVCFDNRTCNKKQFHNKEDIDRITFWAKIRSKSQLDCNCRICGSDNQIEMHHVRHIKKMGSAVKGFHIIMASLNRKQIPVCKECHTRIHRGEYDSISLKDLAY